jgi:NADH-quinone oxidoreductase subunit H
MLPVALGYILVVASASLVLDALGVARTPIFSLALFGLNVVIIALLLRWLDRGKLISPASARIGAHELERLRARGLEYSRRQLAAQQQLAQRRLAVSTAARQPALAAPGAQTIVPPLAEGDN